MFQGKVVLVTGAASGIGRLAAQRMADAGAQVAAVDVNEAGLRSTAEGRDSAAASTSAITNSEGPLIQKSPGNRHQLSGR